MPGDTAMSFDWIFFAIVAPWPILALWAAFVPRQPLPGEQIGGRPERR